MDESAKPTTQSYRYRIAFGCWINDMRNQAMPNEPWPCAWFDDQTERDLERTMRLQAASGFNVFDLFGFFATYAWPIDISSGVDEQRVARARRMIDLAHSLGLKVIHGTGVYSWGFDEIIKANPAVAGPNPHAMCGSSEQSWTWMKKVLDFVLERFPLDGFHLEASDQGRCTCPQCARMGDVEYYSMLNARAADYIRSKAPEKLLLVNMCGYLPWGGRMAPSEYQHLVKLSRSIDVLIEPGHHKQYFTNPDDWPTLIPSLQCAFGTSGHIWVYPPQRWDRMRWFLPYTQRTGHHLVDLRSIGGNACEYYMGPIVNPGVEMNVAFGGRMMSNPSHSPIKVLQQAIEQLYRPRSPIACQDLAQLFVRAEDAYFTNCAYDILAPTRRESHELYLADLFDMNAQPPVYLGQTWGDRVLMTAAGRRKYGRQLSALSEEFATLAPDCHDDGRIGRIRTCIQGVLKDIEAMPKA